MTGRAHPEQLAAESQPGQTKDAGSAGETQELRALSVQEIELRLKGHAGHAGHAGDAHAAPFTEDDAHPSSSDLAATELDHALYDEYVRGFDEVPTLHDAVHLPPRPAPQPDFRRGERPDRRKEPRLDAQALREAKAAEVEQAYREYERPEPAPVAERKKPKRAKPRKSGKRKKR